MGKSKSLELPAPPTYKQPELALSNNSLLSDYGKKLSSGDLTGNLSWLSPLVNNNNSANSLAYAQALLQPQLRDTIQSITNSAANAGSLNSSTFTDALAKASSDTNSQYQAILAQQAINDANQSNQNRLNLFGTGLNTLQQTIGNDVGMAGNENQFNLSNYDNLVARAIAEKGNGSNIFGGLGTALGAGAGFLIGGPMGAGVGASIGGGLGGAIDSSQGGTGSAGFSGMGAGLGILGGYSYQNPINKSRIGLSAKSAGEFASNDPFSSKNIDISKIIDNYDFTKN